MSQVHNDMLGAQFVNSGRSLDILNDPAWHKAIASHLGLTEKRVANSLAGGSFAPARQTRTGQKENIPTPELEADRDRATEAAATATALFTNNQTAAHVVRAMEDGDIDIATLQQHRNGLKALMSVQDEITGASQDKAILARTKFEQASTRYLAVEHFKHGGFGDGTVTIKGEKVPVYDHGRMLDPKATDLQQGFVYNDAAAKFAVRKKLVTQSEIDTGKGVTDPLSKADFENKRREDLAKHRQETEAAFADKHVQSDRYSALNQLTRQIENHFAELGLYSI